MQVFADDGARIDARIAGRGHERAVVLIHGFPFTNAIWESQGNALAQTFCVLMPDLRGAGKSSAPEGPYLMERLAADIAVLLDALGIESAAVIGHSMGGYVALAFARMFTERVKRLGLIASRLRADTPAEAAARRELATRVDRESSIEPVVEAYLPRLLAAQTLAGRPEIVERAYAIARHTSAAGVAGALRGMALRAPSDDIAEDLGVPMLMLAGGSDRTLPIAEARADAERFARGRLAICNASGHLPMLEEASCVDGALQAWLSESPET
jgi:3-oxoadipate enol-lactonase